MYDTMDLIVPILIIVAIAVIILAFFKSMKEINDNKKAPLFSVPAKVAGKRTDTQEDHPFYMIDFHINCT